MGNVRMVILEGLTAEEAMKLVQSGFPAENVAVAPAPVQRELVGVQATIRTPAPAPQPERKKEPDVQAPAAEPVKPAAPPPPLSPPAAGGKEGDPAYLPDLIVATKMQSVIEVLQKNGVTEEEAIIRACQELRDRVPILKRVSDVPTRVRNTLAYLQKQPA